MKRTARRRRIQHGHTSWHDVLWLNPEHDLIHGQLLGRPHLHTAPRHHGTTAPRHSVGKLAGSTHARVGCEQQGILLWGANSGGVVLWRARIVASTRLHCGIAHMEYFIARHATLFIGAS